MPQPAELAADEAALPDRVLRSALEFVVLVAAAGQKSRPQLVFPAGLRPYLKFQSLPLPALAKVRAVVQADGDFLQRLGTVATPDLVDGVGMLWITRPEGWLADAVALVAEQDAAQHAGDAAAALRREQKRREAAEGAAARWRVELVSIRDQLNAERTERVAADAEVDRLRTELVAAKGRLIEVEQMARRKVAGAASGDARAEAAGHEAASLRAELADAIAARDAALADRAAVHSDGPVDLERIRLLLTEALVLSKGGTPKARRRQRRPLAVPGGLYGDSQAAAAHLVRTPDAVVLVDGYNVAKLGWPTLTLEQQRNSCIDAAENLARRWGTLLHVVFDGASIVGATAERRRLVRVSFSPEGVTADDVLRGEVAAIDPDRPVVVVTNDQAVVADVRAAGANTVSSDVFLAIARR